MTRGEISAVPFGGFAKDECKHRVGDKSHRHFTPEWMDKNRLGLMAEVFDTRRLNLNGNCGED